MRLLVNEGFIVSNKNRQAIFVELMAGEDDLERIAKKHRLIERVAERSMEALVDEGVAEETDDGGYALTDVGEKLAHDLKNKELIT